MPRRETRPTDLNFDALVTEASEGTAPSDLNFDALVPADKTEKEKPTTPPMHRTIRDHDGRGDGWEEM